MLDQPLPEFGLQDSSFGNSATDIFFVSFDIAIEDTPGHSELGTTTWKCLRRRL
jgi:hypothetical protein